MPCKCFIPSPNVLDMTAAKMRTKVFLASSAALQTHFCCAAGCSKDTFDECVRDMVFGLPKAHWSYVRNIVPGWEALLAALKLVAFHACTRLCTLRL